MKSEALLLGLRNLVLFWVVNLYTDFVGNVFCVRNYSFICQETLKLCLSFFS